MKQDVAAKKIRRALRELDEGAAHKPGRPPDVSEIFTPQEHSAALDPERSLVVGNRGVGKTFWSTALVDDKTRAHVAKVRAYSRLKLDNIEAAIGYDGGYSGNAAPSRDVVDTIEKAGVQSRRIWEAVLLRHLAPRIGAQLPKGWKNAALWLQNNVEDGERLLRQVDDYFASRGRRFLLIFDALDTLGTSWSELRPRLRGLLEFARLTKSLRAIRTKLFIRVDQAQDRELWASPDLSKLFNERVRLYWSQYALYELLFFHLHTKAHSEFVTLTETPWTPGLWSDTEHREMFTRMAGAYMGGGAKRGNTYDWLTNHLADAAEETTPRAFLVALKAAAEHHSESRPGVIDHLDIQAGVVRASEGRVRELEEDYWWIRTAFDPLAGVSVPCMPDDFDFRWQHAKTAQRIRRAAREGIRLIPLAFESLNDKDVTGAFGSTDEARLRTNLEIIGVLEQRSNGKINVPDIFRVAASIKRRGGVRPPPQRRSG